jgi:hypothetical protein
MHALGTSLADIAAFMQEVELDLGMNPTYGDRGIDRLRLLARQIQNQPELVDEEAGGEEEAEGKDHDLWR